MSDPVIVRKLRELAQYLKSTYTTVVQVHRRCVSL
jgi:hypothetical protein